MRNPHAEAVTATPFMRKKVLYSLLLAMAFAGCSDVNKDANQEVSDSITRQFDSTGDEPIDFSKLGPVGWERMCVIGPYAMNETVEKTLGFKWDALSKSSIGSNDGINLLVFIKDNAVIAYTEHPRNKGDFLKLKPRCLTHQDAILKREPDAGGWVQLVHESATQ
jgi:hypothetical protein